ncbi:hypothetical protein AVEN_102519-1 [Araneus ventricosus]|uniref:Uncharacterized protein n=1 Tax=Araneus ventricosus TaxID=182803 RepID=A0A4Y2NJA9_ARAVE|nr:hypothetical protein AVEN_102519-1 [Araneus ventricosus]
MRPHVTILETETEKKLALKVTGCFSDVCAAAKACLYDILQYLQKHIINEKFMMSLNKEVQEIVDRGPLKSSSTFDVSITNPVTIVVVTHRIVKLDWVMMRQEPHVPLHCGWKPWISVFEIFIN